MNKAEDIEQLIYRELPPDRYCYIHNFIVEKDKEIERLNNIINELEKWIKKEIFDLTGDYDYQGVVSGYENVLDVLQELKGSDE